MNKFGSKNLIRFFKSFIIFSIFIFIILCSVRKGMELFFKNDSKNEMEYLQDIVTDIQKEDKVIPVNDILKLNNDIVGWIKIDGTNINYPIMKDNGSLYYLKHSFEKKYNSNGSIFTFCEHPFEKFETVIYGHNMCNNWMFSELLNYYNEDFLNSNKQFKVFALNKLYIAEIISVYSINFNSDISDSLNFNDKLKYYTNLSMYKNLKSINSNKLIKLITCDYGKNKLKKTKDRCCIIATLKEL